MKDQVYSDEKEDFELNIYSSQRLQSEIDEQRDIEFMKNSLKEVFPEEDVDNLDDELFRINEKPNDDDVDRYKETQDE